MAELGASQKHTAIRITPRPKLQLPINGYLEPLERVFLVSTKCIDAWHLFAPRLKLVSLPANGDVNFLFMPVRSRCLTKKAEPPPTRDVNRDSGTASANGGWLRREAV